MTKTNKNIEYTCDYSTDEELTIHMHWEGFAAFYQSDLSKLGEQTIALATELGYLFCHRRTEDGTLRVDDVNGAIAHFQGRIAELFAGTAAAHEGDCC